MYMSIPWQSLSFKGSMTSFNSQSPFCDVGAGTSGTSTESALDTCKLHS